jgi:hypothetical protein
LLQRANLLELINLIDIQTQNQAYLPMKEIETTNVNMLGTEGLKKSHTYIQYKVAERKDP